MKDYIYDMIDLRNSLDKEWDKLMDIAKRNLAVLMTQKYS